MSIKKQLELAFSSFILSASGWRKLFHQNEQSLDSDISLHDSLLLNWAAESFVQFLRTNPSIENLRTGSPGKKKLHILLARDSRPTGKTIEELLSYSLLQYQDITLDILGLCSITEMLAWMRSKENTAEAFIYISASHNPVAYNGLKMGLWDGGVLNVFHSQNLIEIYQNTVHQHLSYTTPTSLENSPQLIKRLKELIQKCPDIKYKAKKAYWNFSQEIFSLGIPLSTLENRLKQGLEKNPLGLLADFNGSSRAVSIDSEFFPHWGVSWKNFHETPGFFAHEIIPEGDSLLFAQKKLEELHQEHKEFKLAYVPDCDGDRGNIVLIDQKEHAQILKAQEGFALSVVAELCFLIDAKKLTYSNEGHAQQRVAIVVNDATSLRIDAIAQIFDVEVFRAEVGEANVVALADQCASEGYLLRILGEGSNGGSIVFPARVRDPLNTLSSLIKFHALRELQDIWLTRTGFDLSHPRDLFSLMLTLPAYQTTSTSEKRALFQLPNVEQRVVKNLYEKLFVQEWEEHRAWFAQYNIDSWSIFHYEGLVTRKGLGQYSEDASGGFKVIFYDTQQNPLASLWMRGSKTEPVFRVMADIRSKNPQDEEELLSWHRSLLQKLLNQLT